MRNRVEDFQPGDFTVTPVVNGFMIGRVLPEREIDGPWWTIVKIVTDKGTAIIEALGHATAEHRHVWYSEDPGRFTLLDRELLWLGTDREWCVLSRESVTPKVPALPGVYVVRAFTPVVVGETENLQERLLYHLTDIRNCDATKGRSLEFCYEVVLKATEREERARDLIAWWSPPCVRSI